MIDYTEVDYMLPMNVFLKFTTEQMSEGEANKWNLSPGPDHF